MAELTLNDIDSANPVKRDVVYTYSTIYALHWYMTAPAELATM